MNQQTQTLQQEQQDEFFLSDEQKKRLELIEQYEKDTAAERKGWNDGIAQHEKQFTEKWLTLQNDLELKRAESIEKLRAQGLDDQQVSAFVSHEIAAATEKHILGKYEAAKKLDVQAPKSWSDWLAEKKQEFPEDPTFDSLLEEAKQTPALDGYLKNPPPRSVVTELIPRPGKEGKVDYMRGMLSVITDAGPRLDVHRNNDRDIEAALKIAAQKFDTEKGLMLTGDLAFKRQAAEIAGRLGLTIQNTEPEVLLAHKKGAQLAKGMQLAETPAVGNGIEGEVFDKAIAALRGPMILRADSHAIEALKKNPQEGVQIGTDETIVMDGERVWAAQAEIRELPMDVLPILAQVDLDKADGGLSKEQIEVLERENQGLIENGKLTPKAVDVVLVRDDRIIRTRESMSPDSAEKLGLNYRTAGERIKEQQEERETGKTKEALQEERIGEKSQSFKKNPTQQHEEELEKERKKEQEQQLEDFPLLPSRRRSKEEPGLGL